MKPRYNPFVQNSLAIVALIGDLVVLALLRRQRA
jgi:hypothetical protein